jgi:hypothetical protein
VAGGELESFVYIWVDLQVEPPSGGQNRVVVPQAGTMGRDSGPCTNSPLGRASLRLLIVPRVVPFKTRPRVAYRARSFWNPIT